MEGGLLAHIDSVEFEHGSVENHVGNFGLANGAEILVLRFFLVENAHSGAANVAH